MIVLGFEVLLTALLLTCLLSFAWAMRAFFIQPAGLTPGMRVITICGVVFSLMHVAAVAIAGPVSTVRGAAGAVLYMLALGLFWWAVRANRNAPLSAVFSPDAPAHLTRTGPYRSIRHPFYSSYLLAWTAGPVATNQWWLIPTVLFMLAVYIHASDVEERKFESSGLADDYRSYRAQTGRFVPNLFKLLARRTR